MFAQVKVTVPRVSAFTWRSGIVCANKLTVRVSSWAVEHFGSANSIRYTIIKLCNVFLSVKERRDENSNCSTKSLMRSSHASVGNARFWTKAKFMLLTKLSALTFCRFDACANSSFSSSTSHSFRFCFLWTSERTCWTGSCSEAGWHWVEVMAFIVSSLGVAIKSPIIESVSCGREVLGLTGVVGGRSIWYSKEASTGSVLVWGVAGGVERIWELSARAKKYLRREFERR